MNNIICLTATQTGIRVVVDGWRKSLVLSRYEKCDTITTTEEYTKSEEWFDTAPI